MLMSITDLRTEETRIFSMSDDEARTIDKFLDIGYIGDILKDECQIKVEFTKKKIENF